MNAWLRRALIALVVLLVLGGGAYYWLVLESGTPSGTFALDIKEVRRLADSLPGPKALAIHDEHVATFAFRRNLVLAGDGWAPLPMAVFAYKVDYGPHIVIVDTGLSPRGAQELGATIDEDAYRRVRSALKYAAVIVVTHEHNDHIGGLLASPWMELELAHAKLTTEQVAHLDDYNPSYRKEGFATYKPVSYARYLAVAPGVVLIKAPGHTPGSQMVYVKLANGQEYLFTGDVAWTMRNIDTRRERARATTLVLKEDRDAVLAQLAALNALKAAEPKLHIVPGHDLDAVTALEDKGLLVKTFGNGRAT
ncbi:MAG: MBL fold metallo-hydrolase [Rhizomicrobium sp.]